MKAFSAAGVITGLCIVVSMSNLSCNNGTDGVKEAKKENAQKTESTRIAESPIDTAVGVVSREDANFVVTAVSGGMMEVELGKLAQTNAQDQGVRVFANRMALDHSMEGASLKAIAGARKIVLPMSISNGQQKEVERLKARKGSDFDKAYIDLTVREHKADISEFQKAAAGSHDSNIRTFADTTLRMLKTHLDSAENLQKRLVRH